MKVSLLQHNPEYLQVDANLDRVEALLQGLDTDLLVLPELFASGYFFHDTAAVRRVAETVPQGPTCDRLHGWAKTTGTTIVAGLPERAGDRLFNSAVIVSPEGWQGTYRKIHLFFEEKRHFTPGDSGLQVFDLQTRAGEAYRLGVMVCFDWYFPEAARSLALQGAQIIAHPANLVRKDCPRAMPIRALENHVYTVTANRYGTEQHGEASLTYIGQSLICDPAGHPLATAAREGDHLLTVDVAPHAADDRRLNAFNHLFDDRRPEAYLGLASHTK